MKCSGTHAGFTKKLMKYRQKGNGQVEAPIKLIYYYSAPCRGNLKGFSTDPLLTLPPDCTTPRTQT